MAYHSESQSNPVRQSIMASCNIIGLPNHKRHIISSHRDMRYAQAGNMTSDSVNAQSGKNRDMPKQAIWHPNSVKRRERQKPRYAQACNMTFEFGKRPEWLKTEICPSRQYVTPAHAVDIEFGKRPERQKPRYAQAGNMTSEFGKRPEWQKPKQAIWHSNSVNAQSG